MHRVLSAPLTMLFELEFLLYTPHVFVGIIIKALAVRTSETN